MWLTSSKNASEEVKKKARALANAVPGATFMPRGETKLGRLDERAKRAGEKTLLVIMAGEKAGKSAPYFVIRSRHLVLDEAGHEAWAWDARSLAVQKMKTGANPMQIIGEDAYVFVCGIEKKETPALLSFLGLENHPLAEFADEPLEVKLDVKKTKSKKNNSLKMTAGNEELLSLEYEWVE